MRFMIDVLHTEDDRVEGIVTREGDPTPVRFSGWLELMHLLEPATHGDGSSHARSDHDVCPHDVKHGAERAHTVGVAAIS